MNIGARGLLSKRLHHSVAVTPAPVRLSRVSRRLLARPCPRKWLIYRNRPLIGLITSIVKLLSSRVTDMFGPINSVNLRGLLEKRLPVVTWLPKYRPSTAVADLIAGITVGLTLIPQAIAYAALAGLHPQVTFWFHHSSTVSLVLRTISTVGARSIDTTQTEFLIQTKQPCLHGMKPWILTVFMQ